MNVTIYTPEGADGVTVNDFATGDYGVTNDQAYGMMLASVEFAIFVYENGRAFYCRAWGFEGSQIVDRYDYMPDRFRRRFDLLIEQHHLNIITVAEANAYLYDVALTDTTVLDRTAQVHLLPEVL